MGLFHINLELDIVFKQQRSKTRFDKPIFYHEEILHLKTSYIQASSVNHFSLYCKGKNNIIQRIKNTTKWKKIGYSNTYW